LKQIVETYLSKTATALPFAKQKSFFAMGFGAIAKPVVLPQLP